MLIDITNLHFFKSVNGIIHIGAHDCEERTIYLSNFKNLNDNDIVWIDALEEKVTKIKQTYPSIRIFNECISNNDNESVIFNITNNYQSSSFLNLKEHLIEHPDIYNIKQIEMKTKTLKTFYNENNFSYDKFNFMALDIQGAELLALKGAQEILNYVDFIYLEVNTKELYENCALLNDVEKYLKKYNFQKQTILMTEHGWGDAFYVKNKFNILNNYKIEYGIDNTKIDITDIVLKNNKNNHFFHISKGDEERASLFGDPIFGKVKNIYISDENNSFVIKSTDYVNFNTNNNTLYINTENNIKKLCIMSIFKNETMNLKVWLEHYLWQGVEHFYLIDNDSSDNPLHILQKYVDNGIVTYYFKPEKYQQENHYRNVFDNENLKEKTQWLCICDLDEFFFGSEQKLSNALDEYQEYDVINTHSFFYGSDNLINHPKDIRTQIIHRTSDLQNGQKYIFKPSSINNSSEIWIHWLVEPGTFQKKSGLNETFTDTKIRLNHYLIQSLEYWQNIKMKRGDVNNIQNENIRNMDTFYYYEKEANIKDDILKVIVENTNHNLNFYNLKFYDENSNIIDNKSIECHEQKLTKQYILDNDIVLELGARYGTVSCTINKKLYNKKNQISVEPDSRVWDALEFNKIYNNCNFTIVKGFISNKKLDLTNLGEGMSGYGATFIENNNTKIPSYSLNEIKNKYNINKFTALVADCEGFLETFFDENPDLYNDLRLIIFEADYADKCNYDKIVKNLYDNGFKNEISGHQNVWIKPTRL